MIVVHQGLAGIAICVALLVLARTTRRLFTRWKDTDRPRLNAWIAVASLAFALLGLELVFMFVPKSHAAHLALSSQVWSLYYATPTNSMGYRDAEIPADPGGDTTVVVVGDSNTFGAGIDDVDGRYTNLLDRRLGVGARVYNLGVPGASTRHEIDALVRFPHRPDLIVLQYHINDLDAPGFEVARRTRDVDVRDLIQPYADVPSALRPLVRYSFLLNFVYWLSPHETLTPYIDFLKSLLDDEEVWEVHLRELAKLSTIQQQTGIPVIALMVPALDEEGIDVAQPYYRRVASFLRDQGVRVVEVRDEAAKLPLSQRIVSANDPHPSRAVHAIMASALHAMIEAEGLLDPSRAPAGRRPAGKRPGRWPPEL
jgi:lysophospholipase L1-like esterase